SILAMMAQSINHDLDSGCIGAVLEPLALRFDHLMQNYPYSNVSLKGFGSIPLDKDLIAAEAKASKLNQEWDRIRQGEQEIVKNRGDFDWLISTFQKDPVWYEEKAVTPLGKKLTMFFLSYLKLLENIRLKYLLEDMGGHFITVN
ncbi:MAG: hypothetical protein HQL71_14610, partial [Magnetococcales bacterium]|nr:hypothetical protein [Magnetococcales bacterium]